MATLRANGTTLSTVVADHDAVVFDDAMGVHRQILAGQPVPPELLEAYQTEPTKPTAKAVREPAVDKAVRGPQASK